MVRRLKEDIRERPGRLPQAERRARRDRRPAGGRPRTRALPPARRVPHRARGALREHHAPGAGGRGSARRRLAAAPPLLDRGVRAQPQGPPRDRGAAVGEGAGQRDCRGRSRATTGRGALHHRPDADDERGEWTPRSSRPRRRPRSRPSPPPRRPTSPRDATAEALWRREQALLDQMQAIAEEARHLPDAKIRRLIDWIRENLCPDLPPFGQAAARAAPPQWNNRRVLIFTENREGTKRYLQDASSNRRSRAPTAPTSASR